MNPETNQECYNQTSPPKVPLENITLRDVYLFSSQNDLLADPDDVERLKKALKGRYLLPTRLVVLVDEFE